jgi:hypothetical protein
MYLLGGCMNKILRKKKAGLKKRGSTPVFYKRYLLGMLWAITTSIFLITMSATLVSAASVPDTAQTGDFTSTFGEDSDYTHNTQSFTKLGPGGVELPDNAIDWVMVKDNVTGLMWEAKTDDGTTNDKDNVYSWDESQNVFIQTLNDNTFGGFSDWRLPNAKELAYIVDMSTRNPAINLTYFPNTYNSYHWSSNADATYGGMAWRVNFIASWTSRASKSNALHVRAVRGQEVLQNLIDNGDGTVTDTSTGLMWQQGNAPQKYTWEGALNYAESLTLAGYSDWHLPNQNELKSLVDYSVHHPAINTTFFPDTYFLDGNLDWYWTSTSRQSSPYDHAWVVGFIVGRSYYTDQSYLAGKDKTSSFHVRAVRTATGADSIAPATPGNLTVKP